MTRAGVPAATTLTSYAWVYTWKSDDETVTAGAPGTKRGLCGHTCESALLFSPRSRQWQYNYMLNLSSLDAEWASRKECKKLATSPDYDYSPMVAHCKSVQCPLLSEAAASIPPTATKLLAMNEPNGNPNACDDPTSKACKKMCLPSVAAAMWPQFERLAAASSPPRLLGTPAPGGLWKGLGTRERPVPWLQEWFGNCTQLYGAHGCRFDFVAVHYYECWGNTSASAEQASVEMMSFLDSVYAIFKKPLWLTEFNCGDGSGPTANQPPANHLRFMKAALPKLEAAPQVHRYSWFFDEPGRVASLTSRVGDDPETGPLQLTELGQYYDSYTHPAAALQGDDEGTPSVTVSIDSSSSAFAVSDGGKQV